jgi:hypothetical protein
MLAIEPFERLLGAKDEPLPSGGGHLHAGGRLLALRRRLVHGVGGVPVLAVG